MDNGTRIRVRWAAIGAAIAVTLGAGGVGIAGATLGSGERTSFVPINPCRIADTRPGDDNRGPRATPLGAGETHIVSAWGEVGDCNLTNQATGLVLNVTTVNQTQLTYLTIYPTGATQPLTSNLNPSPGQPPTPNAVTVDLNGSGQFSIYNLQGSVDVIVDIVGYYEDHNHDDRYYTKTEVNTRLSGSYNCAATEFLPTDASTVWSGALQRTTSLADAAFWCAVHPPTGATLTGLSAALLDNSATYNSNCLLYRRSNTAVAFFLMGETTTTSGNTVFPQAVSDASFVPAIVQPATNYQILCETGAGRGIQGATVTYTMP